MEMEAGKAVHVAYLLQYLKWFLFQITFFSLRMNSELA